MVSPLRKFFWVGLAVLLLSLSACGTRQVEEDGKLRVVATTTIVADVLSQVAGDLVDLSVLLPPGSDPHGFSPTPQDIAAVADADLVFANGAGLEEFLTPLLENAGGGAEVVHASEGIDFLEFDGEHDEDLGEGQAEDQGEDHHHEGIDPHVWFDPNNVVVWVDNFVAALAAADPDNAAIYTANGESYKAELESLHAWIEAQVALIPQANRLLVTDHRVFGYFAARYGFEQVGAVVPGYSTLSEPSAEELATLEDAIRAFQVKAILVGETVNPNLAQRVADDTGTQIVLVYTGSLSAADGPASTYLDFMRYNVDVIVGALK